MDIDAETHRQNVTGRRGQRPGGREDERRDTGERRGELGGWVGGQRPSTPVRVCRAGGRPGAEPLRQLVPAPSQGPGLLSRPVLTWDHSKLQDFLGGPSSPFSAKEEASFSEAMETNADLSGEHAKGTTGEQDPSCLARVSETLRESHAQHPCGELSPAHQELGSLAHSAPLCPAGAQAGSCPPHSARAHGAAPLSAHSLKDMGERILVPRQQVADCSEDPDLPTFVPRP